MRITIPLILILFLMHPVHAQPSQLSASSTALYNNHNVFDPYLDRSSIDNFGRRLYFTASDILPCVDLDEFYAHADSNPFDRYSRDDVKDYLGKLSAPDFQRVARENPFDNIDSNRFDIQDQYRCSTREQFYDLSDKNRFDNLNRDDYYTNYGFRDERDFSNQIRHDEYEVPWYNDGPDYIGYRYASPRSFRFDKFGGVASWVRFG